MLQQTQVQTVLPYYRAWINRYPNVRALARASLQEVLKAWQGLGYYARPRNMWHAAQLIVKKFNGRFPQSYDELRLLPGLGPYTTSAILSFAFGQAYPVIDANVRRVLMRLAGLKGHADSSRDRALLGFLKAFFPARNSREFNQAIMELGALVCKPRNPACLVCPIQNSCRAFARGEQEIIPHSKSQPKERVEAVVAVVRKDAKYLIQKRPERGLFAGLWEFPGGKRKAGETLEEALQREVREELSAEIEKTRYLLRVDHAYTRFRVTLHAFECRLFSRPRLNKKKHRWVALESLLKYPFPSGSAKIIEYLKNEEKSKKELEGASPALLS